MNPPRRQVSVPPATIKRAARLGGSTLPASGCIALCGLLLALPLLLRQLPGQGQFDLFVLASIGIFVIAVIGQHVLSGLAGQPSLGNGAFFAVGAYSLAVLLSRYHLSLWLALPLALATSGAVGMAAGLAALRVQGPNVAIISLALVLIVQDLLSKYETHTLQATTLTVARPAALGGDTTFYYYTVGAAALVLLMVGNLMRGRTGRALVALRQSEVAAAMLGVPPGPFRILAFLLSALVTGLAGALEALEQGSVTSSSLGLDLSVLLLSAVVVGGIGSLRGAVLGGCLIAGMADLLRYKLPATVGPIDVGTITPMLSGVVIIVVLTRFPSGLAGAMGRQRRGVERFS